MSRAKKESIMAPQETPLSQLISETPSTPLSTIKTPLEPKARNGDAVSEQILLAERRKDDYSYQKIAFYTLLNVKDKRLQQLKLVGSQQALCLAEKFYSAVVPVDAFCKFLVSSTEHLSMCPYLGTIKDMLLSLWLGLATMSSISVFQRTVNEFIPYYICETALRDMQKSSGFDLKNVILIHTLNVLKERSDRVGLPWYESPNSILLYFVFIFKPSERRTVRKLLQFNAELAHILRAAPAAST
eukprot:XP_001709137.1 Hypothetical protein GL50803_10444 [Giardia lamblia ATCC 50803]